jgi:hypothetical protein
MLAIYPSKYLWFRIEVRDEMPKAHTMNGIVLENSVHDV